MTKAQARATGWAATAILAGLFLALTVPIERYRSPYYMDDWDLIYDLITLPWADYLLRPSVSGHFFPVFKAVYGLSAIIGGLDLDLLLGVQYACRLLLALFWIRLLRALGCWSPTAALLALTVLFNEVGVTEVFFWGVEIGHELAMLAFVAALDGAVRYAATRRAAYLGQQIGASLAGALCFGSGVVPLVSLGAALALAGPRDHLARRAIGAQLAAALCVALAYSLVSREAVVPLAASLFEALLRPATFFLFGTVVNPALSGLAVEVTPGWVNVCFFLALVAGTLYLLRRDPSRGVRLAAAALLLTSIGIGLLLALTKWPRGAPAYGASYRYCYNHVALQMPLVGLLFTRMPVLLAEMVAPPVSRAFAGVRCALVGVLCSLSLFGGLRGTTRLAQLVQQRRECLAQVLARGAGTPPCYERLYYRPAGDFLREVWRLAADRRASLRKAGQATPHERRQLFREEPVAVGREVSIELEIEVRPIADHRKGVGHGEEGQPGRGRAPGDGDVGGWRSEHLRARQEPHALAAPVGPLVDVHSVGHRNDHDGDALPRRDRGDPAECGRHPVHEPGYPRRLQVEGQQVVVGDAGPAPQQPRVEIAPLVAAPDLGLQRFVTTPGLDGEPVEHAAGVVLPLGTKLLGADRLAACSFAVPEDSDEVGGHSAEADGGRPAQRAPPVPDVGFLQRLGEVVPLKNGD